MTLLRRLFAPFFLLIMPLPAQAAPALWEVRDADSSIWLFGSIGNLPADLEWRTPLFDEVLARAEKVVFDSDARPASTAAAGEKYLSLGLYTDGTLLTDLLDDDTEFMLRAAAEATGAPVALFLSMRPWFAINAIYVGTQVAHGVADDSLASRLQQELPTDRLVFLETIEESFRLIQSSSTDEQVAMLTTTLRQLEMIPKVADKVLSNWSAGRPEDAAAGFVLDASGFSGDFVTRVLAHRVGNWTPRIEAMLQSNEENLVIVDTANVIGDGGLLDLLGEAGYTIDRVQ